MERKLTAILYADVVDYSKLVGDDEVSTHNDLTLSLDLLTSLVISNNGRLVHEAGDAILADFTSVVSAVTCALSFQDQLSEQNLARPIDKQLRYRIGLNLGEVIVDRDDIYGDGVNVAARLESLAEPGKVCMSASVYDQIFGKVEHDFFDLGDHQVKNIAKPVRVYGNFELEKVALKDQISSPLFSSEQKPEICITGGCLCGEVRYEINQQAVDTAYCHCRMCQRFTGSPVTVATSFPRESVTFTSGNPQFFEVTHEHSKFYQSSPIAERGFCPKCGSSIIFRPTTQRTSDWVAVFTGSLDEPENFAPLWHLGVESRVPWLNIHDDMPKIKTKDAPFIAEAWAKAGITDI